MMSQNRADTANTISRCLSLLLNPSRKDIELREDVWWNGNRVVICHGGDEVKTNRKLYNEVCSVPAPGSKLLQSVCAFHPLVSCRC